MDIKCIICNNSELKSIYDNTLLKCDKCSFITANMFIDEKTLRNIYTENYFKGEEYLDYVKEKSSIQMNFQKRLQTIYRKVGKYEIKSVLEIGCAYGFFADVLMREYDGSLDYIGFDVVREAVDYGINNFSRNLICGDYLTYKLDKKCTDVFMWDVIEHLNKPQLYIEKISDELETGGRLYITTGDISALLPQIQKHKWRLIHPPSHIHYFSRKSIKMLLEKYGMKIIDIFYPGINRNCKRVFYTLFMFNKPYSKLIKFLYDLIPEKLNFSVNTYDIMFVIAKKYN